MKKPSFLLTSLTTNSVCPIILYLQLIHLPMFFFYLILALGRSVKHCSLHDFTPHIPDGISLMVRSWFFVWFPFSVLSKFHWKRRKFPITKHDYLTLAAKVEFPAQLPFRKYLKLSFPTQCVQSLSAKDRWETA